ncbi:MAG TPA: hypothetical protein VGL19_24600 [Polyangiaceae bacterium]
MTAPGSWLLEYSMMRGAACLVVLLVSEGCVSYPKMSADAPVEVRRGNWVDYARFYQRGRQIDRGDAKKNLAQVAESAKSEHAGQALEVCGIVTAVAGGALLGAGFAQAASKQQAWPYLVSGGAALGLSVTFAITSDNSYISAANAYNAQLGPSGFTPSP